MVILNKTLLDLGKDICAEDKGRFKGSILGKGLGGCTPQLNALLKARRQELDLSRSEVIKEVLQASNGYASDTSKMRIRSLSQMLYNIEKNRASPPVDFLASLIRIYDIPKTEVIQNILLDKKQYLESIL